MCGLLVDMFYTLFPKPYDGADRRARANQMIQPLESPRGFKTKYLPNPVRQRSNNAVQQIAEYQEIAVHPQSKKAYMPETISTANLKQVFAREEAGYRILTKITNDTFNPWFKVTSEDQAVKDSIEEFNRKYNVKYHTRRAYMFGKGLGWSVLFLNMKDETDLLSEVPNVITDLYSIVAKSKEFIVKLILETDINAKEKYGKPVSYTIQQTIEGQRTEVVVAAERIIHFENPSLDSDMQGISIFAPLFNAFMEKEQMDWSLFESLYKNASPLYALGMPEGAGTDKIDAAKAQWRDANTKSHIALPYGFKPDILQTDKGAKPDAHIDYMLTRLGMGSNVGKVMLSGAAAGTLSTSDANKEEYQSFINNEQTELVEPQLLRPLYDWAQEHGFIVQGDYELEWAPMFLPSAKDQAETRNMDADSMLKASSAILNLQASGMQPFVHNDQLYFTDGSGVAILMDGVEAVATDEIEGFEGIVNIDAPAPEPTEPPAENRLTTNALKLTIAERDELRSIWDFENMGLENNYNNDLQSAIVAYENAYMAYLQATWEKNVGPTTNDITDFTVDIVQFDGDGQDIFDVNNEYIGKSYEEGYTQTRRAIDGITTGFPESKLLDVQQYIASQSLLSKRMTDDIDNKMLQATLDGVREGKSYADIVKMVNTATGKYNESIPKVVHKVVHEGMLHAQMDEMQSIGYTEVLWITSGDARVRDEHAQLEGASPIPISLARAHEGDWACRCAISPMSALRTIRAREAALGGAVV